MGSELTRRPETATSLGSAPAGARDGASRRDALRGVGYSQGVQMLSVQRQGPGQVCEAPSDAYDPTIDEEQQMCVDPRAAQAPPQEAAKRAAKTQKKSILDRLDPAHPAKKIDDKIVLEILMALADRATGSTPRQRVKSCWDQIIGIRNRNPQDMNLMAAEHFLYACHESRGTVSGGKMAILTMGYEGVKGALDVFGQRGLLSTDGSEPTPPSLGAMEWGLAGTRECQDMGD